MNITIELTCPHCHSGSITRNGKKSNGKQNYRCKDCGRQFIADYERTYRGTLPAIGATITIMTVRGTGVRDTAVILGISITKVITVLKGLNYRIHPKRKHYGTLEIDEFWTYTGSKKNKVWLIYAYHRKSGEIAAYVWGKRDLKTPQRLKDRLRRLGITCGKIVTDTWNSFITAFSNDTHKTGKHYPDGMLFTCLVFILLKCR